MIHRFSGRSSQNGAALLLALLFGLIISILGLSVGQQLLSVRKASSIAYDRTMSYTAAESAQREAEATITQYAYFGDKQFLDPDFANAVTMVAYADTNWWIDADKWNPENRANPVLNAGEALRGNPSYVIEDSGNDNQLMMGLQLPVRRFFRVTSRAEGLDRAETYLQAYVAIVE